MTRWPVADKRAYFKMDVGYLTNPKVALLAIERPATVLLHVASIAYAAQHLTNGRVPVRLLLRLNAAEQSDADALIAAGLWEQADDGHVLVHDYLEHQRSAEEAKSATEKAKRAADARWNASSMPDAEQAASETAMPREKRERERHIGGPRKRGARIPDDFAVNDEMRHWATSNGMDTLDLDAVTASFCDYWKAASGPTATKLDWIAAWRVWVRKENGNRFAPRKPKVDPRPEWMRQ